MSPRLLPGQLILASRIYIDIKPGEVLIFHQGGKEKIKRVERIDGVKLFFIGDNLEASSDSRHFGWIDKKHVLAKVFWPRINN